jgi:hypothetical protein
LGSAKFFDDNLGSAIFFDDNLGSANFSEAILGSATSERLKNTGLGYKNILKGRRGSKI